MTNGYDSVNVRGTEYVYSKGLTKREHFAAVALQGILSGPLMDMPATGGTSGNSHQRRVARRAKNPKVKEVAEFSNIQYGQLTTQEPK
jgi:hypothetical protein